MIFLTTWTQDRLQTTPANFAAIMIFYTRSWHMNLIPGNHLNFGNVITIMPCSRFHGFPIENLKNIMKKRTTASANRSLTKPSPANEWARFCGSPETSPKKSLMSDAETAFSFLVFKKKGGIFQEPSLRRKAISITTYRDLFAKGQ